MSGQRPQHRHRTLAATGLATAALVVAAAVGPLGSSSAADLASAAQATPVAGQSRGYVDARRNPGTATRAAQLRTSGQVADRTASTRFRRNIADRALLEYDGSTGTVRILQNLDGYLTGASKKPARRIALRYVARHHADLGLTQADLDTFHMRRDYVDITGIHHLSWVQKVDGMLVFGGGLQAAVSPTGRLLTVGGSPVSSPAAPVKSATPKLTSRTAAITAARRAAGERRTAPGSRDAARRVLFVTASHSYPAWQTITMSASEPALSVFDAASGRVLYHRSLSSDASPEGPATGTAFSYFPGHVPGGTQQEINFSRHRWLKKSATRLFGNNAHAYSDVNDDGVAQAREEAPPSSGNAWNYPLRPFRLAKFSFCGKPYPCSWNPNKPYSWRKNRKQNITQVFTFVNTWHDHLLAAPIGFTEAAGNFQNRNKTGKGKAGDYVDAQTDDGANTHNGLPDANHIDNANMSTPPDGHSPTMQMYLQHQPGTSYPDGDPFAPTNVGDEADTVFHEYTHGLSERLVVDATGNSTLAGAQAGSMGEGWSDWYAMDYLVDQGLQKDDPAAVDVVLFQYDGAGAKLDRTEPIDCAVGSSASLCNGGATGHTGGYTYADYAKVVGFPEVHSDGEIWAQTLWSLRDRVGSEASRALVTRAMELAPGSPSFLDMRNALLVADTAVFSGKFHTKIWKTFASRGMGFYAGALGSDDTAPGASFARPPADQTPGTLTGVVRDDATHAPVAGVPVTLAFQGGSGVANPTVVTGPDGSYRLGPVPAGRYPKLVVTAPGYDPTSQEVTVTAGTTSTDIGLRRDWASASGGASVTDFLGPDFTDYGCGPVNAIDNSADAGWVTTVGPDENPVNVVDPKYLTVDLGRAITVSRFGVDPSAACGLGGSASTGAYSIETSPDATTWTTAASGTFTVGDRGRVNLVTPTAGASAVRYVRFHILGNQTPDFTTNCPYGAYDGCTYLALSELEVYGSPTP